MENTEYEGQQGFRRIPVVDGKGGGKVALVDFKKAKKKFYHTLKVDKATLKAIKLYNQVKNMW